MLALVRDGFQPHATNIFRYCMVFSQTLFAINLCSAQSLINLVPTYCSYVPGIKLRIRDTVKKAFKLLATWELGLGDSQRCEQITP